MDRGGSGEVAAGLRIPSGATVPVGTAEIKLNLNLTLAGSDNLSLLYRPPGAEERRLLVNPKDSLSIIVNPEEADLPHTGLSKWKFSLVAVQTDATQLVDLKGTVNASVMRINGALPLSPSHPDRWGEKNQISLFETSGPISEKPVAPGLARQPIERPTLSAIVPWYTGHVVVRFEYNSTTPTDFHYAPLLSYATASGVYVADEPPTTGSPGTPSGSFEWLLAPTMIDWDSPYAEESDWTMFFEWSREALPGTGAYQLFMEGDYYLTITAKKTE